MLEQIDLTKAMGKEAYKEKMEVLEPCLARLQRECKELGIPVLIVFEGFDASGKGVQINKLIHPLDPRGFKVFAIKEETKEELNKDKILEKPAKKVAKKKEEFVDDIDDLQKISESEE